MTISMRAVGSVVLACGVLCAQGSKEWPTYGHDPGGMRFSPLTQLTPENVAKLKVAWVYHMRPAVTPGAATVAPPAAAGRGGAAVGEGDTPPPPAAGRGRGRGALRVGIPRQ